MGGLVARYYVQRLAKAASVYHLITVASPHQGTWMAYLSGNPGARQMRPGSEFLRELDANCAELQEVRFTSIWTPFDLMIVPPRSARTTHAKSIPVRVVAHAWMMRDQQVIQTILHQLRV